MPLFLATIQASCAGDPARLAKVLEGLRRYQSAPPPLPRLPRREVARIGAARLLSCAEHGRPLIIVPSLINAADVLDLAPGQSLIDHLAGQGLRPLLVDWGECEALDLAALVSERLVPLTRQVGEPVAMLGYCMGGTLAIGAASQLGNMVSRLALLATPWHFGGYGDAARGDLGAWWGGAMPMAEQLGAMPMDLLQPAFWSLDPGALAAKFARLADMNDELAAGFVRLEDWANTGTPLSLPAARDLARLFADDMAGRGAWQIAGKVVDPAALVMPVLDICASADRIVPAAAACGAGTRWVLDAGHVGMVVGRRAPEQLWAPLADWLTA